MIIEALVAVFVYHFPKSQYTKCFSNKTFVEYKTVNLNRVKRQLKDIWNGLPVEFPCGSHPNGINKVKSKSVAIRWLAVRDTQEPRIHLKQHKGVFLHSNFRFFFFHFRLISDLFPHMNETDVRTFESCDHIWSVPHVRKTLELGKDRRKWENYWGETKENSERHHKNDPLS